MKTKAFIKAEENFKIEEEKRYQRKNKHAQVEQLTQLKEAKKPKGFSAKK
jgi:hypothetical protein